MYELFFLIKQQIHVFFTKKSTNTTIQQVTTTSLPLNKISQLRHSANVLILMYPIALIWLLAVGY